MSKQKKNFNSITNQVNSLNIEQLSTVFNSYYHLQYYFDFFMSEQTYQEFLNRYNPNPFRYQPETFKTLITLLTTTYTNPERYPDTLKTIELIKNNYSLSDIINIVYHNR